MRTLVWVVTAIPLWAVSFCAVAQSNCSPTPCAATSLVEMQFNFTVVPNGGGPGSWPDNIWNGPGAMPTTLTESFFVDPSTAQGSWSAVPGINGGSVLGRIDESFSASNMTLTADGKVIESLSSGTFAFGGATPFPYGPGASYFGGARLPNGGGGADFFTQYALAPPDWTAFLGTAAFFSAGQEFSISGAFGFLNVNAQGQGIPASVAVPEPGTLALCTLAGLGVLLVQRRRSARSARRGGF
ncbi:MAG: PEP-CTERM sorting domain-containing protein [Proteobacteria bacterium]|nr:PEP-CTERM sorting domain-containing protein [Pseudomonadota bacterium]